MWQVHSPWERSTRAPVASLMAWPTTSFTRWELSGNEEWPRRARTRNDSNGASRARFSAVATSESISAGDDTAGEKLDRPNVRPSASVIRSRSASSVSSTRMRPGIARTLA